MKKRFVSLLLAISMIFSLMPVSAVTAFAESENGGEVTTVDSGYCGADNGGENLRWTLDNNGVLTISGSGAMKDYTWDENVRLDWYVRKKDIRSVVLDNRITHIGDYAFDKCTNIESVRYTGYTGNAGVALPESVTTIGVHAFSDTGVTGTLKLPEHLTEIDSSAFYHCGKLNGELKLPDTVKEIGGFAFNSCGFTGKLELPASLEKIGNDAFESCSGLTGNGTEIDKKVAAVTVKKHENAAVTIDGLDGTTVKAGEAKEFTVNVTPNDDTIDKVTFGTTSGEVQWSSDNGNTWTTVPGDVDYSDLTGKQFRVVPAADAANGTVTVTVTAKKADGTEAAKKDASFTVTKKEEPVTPGGGSTGGGENPGENPGSGSTTPKRKLEIADGTLTSVTVKDENGNLKDITDTITKDLDGKYEIPVGAKVTVTAKDAPEGMKFGEWSISDKTLLSDPDVPSTEKDLIFTMPDNPDGVKLSVVYLEESIGEEPNLVEKGALAGTVVVGSAALLYQGHMLGTELYLRYLLPHGAVIPQNRCGAGSAAVAGCRKSGTCQHHSLQRYKR